MFRIISGDMAHKFLPADRKSSGYGRKHT